MATLTSNINYLQPTAFRLVIDRKNYPNLEYFAQSISHPAVSIPTADLPYARANLHLAGDKLTYDELTATIIVDEDLNAYTEMYSWLERIVEYNNSSALTRRDTTPPTSADITLSILTSHNNANKRFQYVDCIPTSISGINFEATVSDIQYLTFQISFRFSYFKLV